MREIRLPWVQQPQHAVAYNATALSRFGISGGFLVDGVRWPFRQIKSGQELTYSVGSWGQNVGFNGVPSRRGIQGRWSDDGGTRYVTFDTGSPSSRAFTMLMRVRVNVTIGGAGVFGRSGTTGGGTTIPLWRASSAFDMRVAGTDYTQAGSWALGTWYDIDIVGDASSCVLSVDGQPVISGGAAAAGTIDSDMAIGDVAGGGGVSSGDFDIGYFLVCNRALSGGERESLRTNPWQLYAPRRLFVPMTGAGSNVPSITAVYADSITASSVTPRVTLDFP